MKNGKDIGWWASDNGAAQMGPSSSLFPHGACSVHARRPHEACFLVCFNTVVPFLP